MKPGRFKMGMTEVAYALGVPTPGSFLPYVTLLVANHAELTSEFLSSLDLYDSDDRRVGLQVLDGGTYLVGYKRRRKEKLAEQKICLNSRTAELVNRVIELTEPLRQYLREAGDPLWRRLFLTIRSMNTRPDGQHFANQCTKPERYGPDGMAASFVRQTGVALDTANSLIGNFSLRSLRASCGLLVYLKTTSTKAMSEALGHEVLQPRLLDHYLPEPIQAFFRDRWIRIFQAGLICEAMKDSPLQLQASGFESMDELDTFLSAHALRPFAAGNRKGRRTDTGRVAIDVGPEILSLLLSVTEAVESAQCKTSGAASYWAELGREVANYLETLDDRPDLQLCLKRARAKASPTRVAELIVE